MPNHSLTLFKQICLPIVSHQRQDKLYFFAEYFHRINKVTMTAGLGTQYTSFHFKETDCGNDSWNLRPKATVTYGINSNHSLRMSFQSWQFGAGMIMPFGKYNQGSKMLSKWNTNEQHMRIDMRMPYIQLSYNIQWGRQKRETEKLVNTDASADQSSAGGR